ncbi:MAG TPA: hypothetical protein VN898_09840, partial [Candidatus Binatia bacterium]|nr:hypothetical protein [Candidatus Binatia bacterium]
MEGPIIGQAGPGASHETPGLRPCATIRHRRAGSRRGRSMTKGKQQDRRARKRLEVRYGLEEPR